MSDKKIKVYITTVTSNQNIKKYQQLICTILDGHNIKFETIDISDPANEEDKQFMWANATAADGQAKPLPPQIFVDDKYIGDYEKFFDATENNELGDLLGVSLKENKSD